MIALRRRREAKAIPAAFKGDNLAKKSMLLAEMFYSAQGGGKMVFNSKQWKPAKTALKKDAHGKCAYCEAPTSLVAHGDVEHFRPKSVYWWLAFCYDNYLYSCQICNQTHKSDNFPISGSQSAAPAMPAAMPTGADLASLLDRIALDPGLLTEAELDARWGPEQADLVHPYLEDPEPLFRYEVDPLNEEIWLRSAGGARADRAVAASVAFLGINREELLRERFAMYAPLAAFRELLAIPALPAAARSMCEVEVARMQRATEPFAGMRRFFARSWGLPGPA